MDTSLPPSKSLQEALLDSLLTPRNAKLARLYVAIEQLTEDEFSDLEKLENVLEEAKKGVHEEGVRLDRLQRAVEVGKLVRRGMEWAIKCHFPAGNEDRKKGSEIEGDGEASSQSENEESRVHGKPQSLTTLDIHARKHTFYSFASALRYCLHARTTILTRRLTHLRPKSHQQFLKFYTAEHFSFRLTISSQLTPSEKRKIDRVRWCVELRVGQWMERTGARTPGAGKGRWGNGPDGRRWEFVRLKAWRQMSLEEFAAFGDMSDEERREMFTSHGEW